MKFVKSTKIDKLILLFAKKCKHFINYLKISRSSGGYFILKKRNNVRPSYLELNENMQFHLASAI